MDTTRESMQSQQAKLVPDPILSINYLLGELKDLRVLIVETRQMQLGQVAHVEDLERRIKRLESGGF